MRRAPRFDVGFRPDPPRGYVEDLNRFAGQLEIGLSGVETARGG